MPSSESFSTFVVATSAATSMAATDLFTIIASPGSTPVTKKITFVNAQRRLIVPISASGTTTLSGSDFGKTFMFTNATAATIIIPAASSTYSGMSMDIISWGAGPTTLSLQSGNWWNEAKVGTYFVMDQKTTIWCDGTYWYASPLNVGILPQIIVNNGGALSTSGWGSSGPPDSKFSIQTYVPLSARGAYGGLYCTTGHTIYVSNRSDGYGYCVGYATGSSFWSLPILTPGYLWYITDETSAFSNAISVCGFSY